MVLDHPVRPESRYACKGDEHFEGWLKKTEKGRPFFPGDAVFPQQEKTQKRKKIKTGAKETQTPHDKYGVGQKHDNPEDIEEGDKCFPCLSKDKFSLSSS